MTNTSDLFDENKNSNDGLENIELKHGDKGDETAKISKAKILLMKKYIETIEEAQQKLKDLLSPYWVGLDDQHALMATPSRAMMSAEQSGDGKVIEGVFDGESMIGPDGKQYSVPANYASKSKLVEGDVMKLTITASGIFLYKQIGPVERNRVIGVLEKDQNNNFQVVAGSKRYRVLTASVTYYKGEVGDEAVVMVPKAGDSHWAALDNVVKK